MDFFLVGLALWLLIGASGLFFIWGVWKKSWRAFLTSGIAFVIPALIFASAEGWIKLLALLPLLSFFLAFYMKK